MNIEKAIKHLQERSDLYRAGMQEAIREGDYTKSNVLGMTCASTEDTIAALKLIEEEGYHEDKS